MNVQDPKQLSVLAVLVALAGASGGSLLTTRTPDPLSSQLAVLRDEIDRLERRHEYLMRRVLELEQKP